ncbi:MAG: T9SS type A sorting domain-containing protein [Melioribacteraceae bacterium]|nr:T9SS type A sorting domain-containing protein [Melioribacteraceae bacterium]
MKLIICLLLFFICQTNFSQWSSDPATNNAVCTYAFSQSVPLITEDGSGGAVISWLDTRNGNYDIYGQNVSSGGIDQWTTDGNVITSDAAHTTPYQAISDGSGGMVLCWRRRTSLLNYDIYAGQINNSGTVSWTDVIINNETENQQNPALTTDGSGGAIIAWEDNRNKNTSGYDIYAQWINSSGVVQWTATGTAICTRPYVQEKVQIVSDGSGGAIIVWRDLSNGSDYNITAQKINSSGTVQWITDGFPIRNLTGSSASDPKIVTDGSGGAIIVWEDTRSGNSDLYAQRINSSGSVQWAADGVPITTAASTQSDHSVISDGSGGAITVWYDDRLGGGVSRDIYAQKINSSGIVQWTANGDSVCTATGEQTYPNLIGDGSGGAIFAWSDYRNGTDYDIYAQYLNSSGTAQWAFDGVSVSTASGSQTYPVLVSDGSIGAIIAWTDTRSGTNDIYASRVYSAGALPVELTSFSATTIDNGVMLNWATATEVNNYGFEIQKSVAQISNLSKEWKNIGFIEGHGNSNSPKSYQFIDPLKVAERSPQMGTFSRSYRLKQIDTDGTVEYSEVIEVEVKIIPTEYKLTPNYPNPFNPTTNINFSLPESGEVKLIIYDILGKQVAELVNKKMEAGVYEQTFDASQHSSGVYIYMLSVNGNRFVKKMNLIK